MPQERFTRPWTTTAAEGFLGEVNARALPRILNLIVVPQSALPL